MKQTAVDWLFKELWDRPKDKMVWYYILEKAKQMEKEQIKNAFDSGVWEVGYFQINIGAEQFYKETYGEDA